MRRWPFVFTAVMLFIINILRLGSDMKLRVWSDPVCAIPFTGYLFGCAIAVAIRGSNSAPPADLN